MYTLQSMTVFMPAAWRGSSPAALEQVADSTGERCEGRHRGPRDPILQQSGRGEEERTVQTNPTVTRWRLGFMYSAGEGLQAPGEGGTKRLPRGRCALKENGTLYKRRAGRRPFPKSHEAKFALSSAQEAHYVCPLRHL
eukprot:GGOE01053700.1.p1 GENE.GGOE01053700.1~~GGOE01053700.1.p1  ORF type:complete len:139 (-),score=0.49 GGOE01053700.1:10-426(-)